MKTRFFSSLSAIALCLAAGCASSERMMRMSLDESAYKAPSSARIQGYSVKQRHIETKPAEAIPLLNFDAPAINVWPFFLRNDQYTSILWPMADYDNYGIAVRPFFNQEGNEYSILFPLIAWNPVSKDGWALNTYWDIPAKCFGFVPLFFRDNENYSIGILGYINNNASGIFPFLRLSDSLNFVTLFWWARDNHFLFYNKGDFGIFPLLKIGLGGGMSYFPLGYYDAQTENCAFLPLFLHRNDGISFYTLYWLDRQESDPTWGVFPFLLRNRTGLNYYTLAWHQNDPEGTPEQWGVFPLLLRDPKGFSYATLAWSQNDENGDNEQWGVFPFLHSRREGFSYATLAWWRRNENGKFLRGGFFPLAKFNPQGGSYVTLAWWDRNPDKQLLRGGFFPLALFDNKAFNYVANAWWNYENDKLVSGGFFPLARFSNRTGGINHILNTWWVKPQKEGAPLGGYGFFPFFGRIGSEQDFHDFRHWGPLWQSRYMHGFFPFLWADRDWEKTLLLPLFYRDPNTFLCPLFGWNKNPYNNWVSVCGPLVMHHWKDESLTTRYWKNASHNLQYAPKRLVRATGQESWTSAGILGYASSETYLVDDPVNRKKWPLRDSYYDEQTKTYYSEFEATYKDLFDMERAALTSKNGKKPTSDQLLNAVEKHLVLPQEQQRYFHLFPLISVESFLGARQVNVLGGFLLDYNSGPQSVDQKLLLGILNNYRDDKTLNDGTRHEQEFSIVGPFGFSWERSRNFNAPRNTGCVEETDFQTLLLFKSTKRKLREWDLDTPEGRYGDAIEREQFLVETNDKISLAVRIKNLALVRVREGLQDALPLPKNHEEAVALADRLAETFVQQDLTDTKTLIFPLYASEKTPHTSSGILFPLLSGWERTKQSSLNVLFFPFGAIHESYDRNRKDAAPHRNAFPSDYTLEHCSDKWEKLLAALCLARRETYQVRSVKDDFNAELFQTLVQTLEHYESALRTQGIRDMVIPLDREILLSYLRENDISNLPAPTTLENLKKIEKAIHEHTKKNNRYHNYEVYNVISELRWNYESIENESEELKNLAKNNPVAGDAANMSDYYRITLLNLFAEHKIDRPVPTTQTECKTLRDAFFDEWTRVDTATRGGSTFGLLYDEYHYRDINGYSLLKGVLARKDVRNDFERSHVLGFLYRYDRTGTVSRTFYFPFVSTQKDGENSKWSFLWRVFSREKRDGKVSGHILFFPYGD